MSRHPLDVLVVDDDDAVRSSLRTVLEHAGHSVIEAEDGTRALAALDGRQVDAVLLDLAMPGMHGLDALRRIREIAPDTAVIVITGEATLENAMRAGQRGAFDFIEKPPDRERLLHVLAEAAQITRLRRHVPDRAPADDLGILGRSPAILAVHEQVRRIAPSQGRVLITGENGSGKELVAQAIHSESRRSGGPFVKLNCAAIPKDLLESELFGYERGAFTGAVATKKGKLEMADKGTLLLDEIGDLSAESQAKLLRALETGEVERLGATTAVRFDARIVSSTNRDLVEAVEKGDFREDLYYRLNVLPIHVPPLRERGSDIPLLATHFLARFGEAEGRPEKHLSDETIALLSEYHWPGNVRELRNLMERATVLVEGATIEAADLAPWLESAPERDEGRGLRAEVERREAEAIRKALEGANGNVTQAAAGLGIDRTNLHRKMRKYGIGRR